MIDFKGIADSVTGLFKGAGDAVTDVVSVAKNKIPPEEQVKLAQLEADTKTAMFKLEMEAIQNFRKFLVDVEQPEKQPVWLLTVKGLIRPAFSIFFFVQMFIVFGIDFYNYVFGGVTEFKLIQSMPVAWWTILGIVLAFYFGERAGVRITEQFKKAGG